MERVNQFFSANFMAPHGFCFMWLPEILWLHIIADTLIALAYFSIPLALWRFAKKRPDMPFHKIFVLFAAFITLCGLTHLFGIFVMWKPYYGIQGLLMFATGLISAVTAILVWKILPTAITLPSPSELADMNEKLSRSYEEIESKVRERTSELEAANKELEEARRKADLASKAKSDFLANMSHEMRTPMNVVVGLSNILSESAPLTDKQEKYIATLKTSADALLSLIDDLLDIAKIESNHHEVVLSPFSLYHYVSESVAIMEVRAREKGLTLQLDCDGAIYEKIYLGDAKHIRQIVLNLCMNAIKFTEKGGVTVTLNAVEEGTRDIIELSVSDTGIGIAPDKLDAIFEKFVQADNSITRKYGGTGLGLAITKTLVEQMGGTISVGSIVGKGSVFTLRLPLEVTEMDADARGKTTSVPVMTPAQAASRKILLVEDYEPNVMVASVLLEQQGYEYSVATRGDDAVAQYKSGNFALILMDIQMPGQNGWEATQTIRRYEAENSLPPVAIIGMTAHAYKADYDRCLEVGMNDYLSKPYTADELYAKIRKLLRD